MFTRAKRIKTLRSYLNRTPTITEADLPTGEDRAVLVRAATDWTAELNAGAAV